MEFRKLLPGIGLNPMEYGLHSGRSGAATDLSNKGVSECDINILGRWRSTTAVQGYIEHSVNRRLVTARRLSINPSTIK